MLEVLIIGAGAAGLSAARQLQKQGVSFKIIEASHRVGGRAWTDQQILGVPVDMGCSWVSGADKNSLTKVGRNAGLTMVDHTNASEALFVGDRRATDAEWDEFEKARRKIDKRLSKAGKTGSTLPASEVIPKDLPFSATAQSWLGPMDYGVNFKDLSPLDHWEQTDDQPSYLVKEGFGTLVATLVDGLDVSLNTKVTRIDWSGDGVELETSQGTLRAARVLITVSTGVLASGDITFHPALPLEKQEAIHNVPMGLLVKVPLLFDGARMGFSEGEWVTYKVDEDQAGKACYFIAWPCGHDYLFGNIGGDLGWELSRAGSDVAVDYAMGALTSMLGNDVRKHFVQGTMTDWAVNPLTYGAYSVQRPGTNGARKALGGSVADRLFFAGEAVGGARAALANGAYDSGKKVAKKIAKKALAAR